MAVREDPRELHARRSEALGRSGDQRRSARLDLVVAPDVGVSVLTWTNTDGSTLPGTVKQLHDELKTAGNSANGLRAFGL